MPDPGAALYLDLSQWAIEDPSRWAAPEPPKTSALLASAQIGTSEDANLQITTLWASQCAQSVKSQDTRSRGCTRDLARRPVLPGCGVEADPRSGHATLVVTPGRRPPPEGPSQ